jgi:hypothetical protein
MKYFKILLLIITFSNVLNAEILRNMVLREDVNRCIYNDYYYKYDADAAKNKFYYRYAGKTTFNSTGTNKKQRYLYDGFVFDTETRECRPDDYLVLGMSLKDFNFLLGLMGVFFGFAFMFFSIELFIKVGGKK